MAGRKRRTPTELACEVCGQPPIPPKARVTLATLSVMVPIEAAANAVALVTDLPLPIKIAVLTLATTALGVWVAEPSVARLFRRWLHASTLRHRHDLNTSAALWRARTTIKDQPGALQSLVRSLSRLHVNILSIHVHAAEGGVLDEFVLSTPESVTEGDLLAALESGGGHDPKAWPSTALALIDGQTKALSLATRIAINPDELALAVAELLSAVIVTPGSGAIAAARDDSGTILKIPSGRGPLVFLRSSEPFTAAESARAHRLAELAEVIELTHLTHLRPGGQER